jgi:histone-lysine N-methyltransferase SETD1
VPRAPKPFLLHLASYPCSSFFFSIISAALMSGKAPPKGPRALLGTQLGSTSSPASPTVPLGPTSHPHQHLLHTQPQSQRPPPSAPTSNINTRIGATPPTGPRSLQIGPRPPPGTKYSLSSHTTPSVPNGLGPHLLQTNRFPVSIKGKNRDIGTSNVVCILFIVYSRSLV